MRRDEDWEFEELDREFETTRMPVNEIEKRLAEERRKNRQKEKVKDAEEEQNIHYERIREPIGDETRVLDAALGIELEKMMTGYENDAEDVVDETVVEDEDFDYYEADEYGSFDEEEDDEEEYYERIPRKNVHRGNNRNFFQNLIYGVAHMGAMDRVVASHRYPGADLCHCHRNCLYFYEKHPGRSCFLQHGGRTAGRSGDYWRKWPGGSNGSNVGTAKHF